MHSEVKDACGDRKVGTDMEKNSVRVLTELEQTASVKTEIPALMSTVKSIIQSLKSVHIE
jgi:hypothetical protein